MVDIVYRNWRLTLVLVVAEGDPDGEEGADYYDMQWAASNPNVRECTLTGTVFIAGVDAYQPLPLFGVLLADFARVVNEYHRGERMRLDATKET